MEFTSSEKPTHRKVHNEKLVPNAEQSVKAATEENIKKLMGLGYPRTQATISLESSGNDLNTAIEVLKNLNALHISQSLTQGAKDKQY